MYVRMYVCTPIPATTPAPPTLKILIIHQSAVADHMMQEHKLGEPEADIHFYHGYYLFADFYLGDSLSYT